MLPANRLPKVASSLVLALALAACGGDGTVPNPGGPGTGGGPTPTPTPTPSPTPTYGSFANLTADQDFASACVGVGADANQSFARRGSQILNSAGLIDYTASSDSWTLTTLNGSSQTFTPAQITSNVAPITRWAAPSNVNPRATLAIEGPLPGGSAAQRSRLAVFDFDLPSSSNPNPQDPITLHCVFGFATETSDVPSASVTFSIIDVNVDIIEQDPANPGNRVTTGGFDGSGSITWNPQAGEVTFSLSYDINDQGGVVTFGPLTGTLTTDTSNGRIGFSGMLTATPTSGIGNTSQYEVVGGFFGPSGEEIGFVISAVADDDADGFNEELIIVRGVAL